MFLSFSAFVKSLSLMLFSFIKKLSVMLFSDNKENKGATLLPSGQCTTAHASKGCDEVSPTWALNNLHEEQPSAPSTRRPSTDLDAFSHRSSDETASDASEHSLKEGMSVPPWFLSGLYDAEEESGQVIEVAKDGSARFVQYDDLPAGSQCSDETDTSGHSLMEGAGIPAIPFPFSLYQFGGNLAPAIFLSALNSDESGRVIEVSMDGTGRFVPHDELPNFSDETSGDARKDSSVEVKGLLSMFLNDLILNDLHSEEMNPAESIEFAMDELRNASGHTLAEVPANPFPLSLFQAMFLKDSEEVVRLGIPAMFLTDLHSEEESGHVIEVATDGRASYVQCD